MQHRDLKSANILLVVIDGVLVAKVSDFGMAELKSGACSTTRGNKGGTVSFTAPEAFKGNFSEASDVYSFYMLLYELATYKVISLEYIF